MTDIFFVFLILIGGTGSKVRGSPVFSDLSSGEHECLYNILLCIHQLLFRYLTLCETVNIATPRC